MPIRSESQAMRSTTGRTSATRRREWQRRRKTSTGSARTSSSATSACSVATRKAKRLRLDNSENCRLRSESAFAGAGQIKPLKSRLAGTSAGLTISSQTRKIADIAGPRRRDHVILDAAPLIFLTKTADSTWDILARQRLLCRRGNHANDHSCVARAGWNVFDQYLCRCRFMVRDLPTGRLKLRLFLVRAMLGDGSRPGGILRAESFPRNGLRDGRRKLEYPRLAEPLSA